MPPEYGPFSRRPYDVRSVWYLFDTHRAVGGSDPQRWVIGILILFGLCCLALALLHPRECRRTLRVLLCLTPLLSGCVATVLQLHLVFIGEGMDWVGIAASPDESVVYTLYSSHLGFYGTTILFVLLGL